MVEIRHRSNFSDDRKKKKWRGKVLGWKVRGILETEGLGHSSTEAEKAMEAHRDAQEVETYLYPLTFAMMETIFGRRHSTNVTQITHGNESLVRIAQTV